MPFDKPTRNLLAKMVAQCRDRLAEDIADQLQSSYGLYPDGTALDVAKTEGDRRAAEDLLALWAHFEAAEAGSIKARRAIAYQRLVREIGFTLLNRLAALRLCEERGLLVECVRRGLASDGFQLFDRIAGGALGNRYQTYCAFLESLFDELALDLGVLFDRSTPQSLVFPSEAALTEVLAWLNDLELAAHDVWQQDETIGWIYQYYNDPAERRAMRDASSAPRNSRELAVRNQFFTPRYVVEFLTDNTLGRIWYEMRQGDTRLAEQCRYLVRRPNEIFLQRGEDPPQDQENPSGLSQEELLEQPVYIPYRPIKDPRDLKILDPACGSGHFLLYAFDLLTTIYEEAWGDPTIPLFTETGTRLADDCADLDALRRAIPGLILRHNLHGIDIDPRAVQIAALALWLRAQRAYQDLGLAPAERPRITRTNLVTAEPMPGDRELLDEFVSDLRPRVLGDLVRVVFEKMELAGEAGSLLKIEEELEEAIAEARRQWTAGSKVEQMLLFPEDRRPRPEQLPLFDVSGITDAAFWETAEAQVLQALHDYAMRVENGKSTRRRLFAEDAAQGFAFVDLCRKQFDTTLMNPPFGSPSEIGKKYTTRKYPDCKDDIDASFVRRGVDLLGQCGFIGAIINRTQFFKPTLRKWREDVLLNWCNFEVASDLGYGILDTALVEAASYVLRKPQDSKRRSCFFRLLRYRDKEATLVALTETLHSIQSTASETFVLHPSAFSKLPESRISYWATTAIRNCFEKFSAFEGNLGSAKQGLATANNFRYLRVAWEVSPKLIGQDVGVFRIGKAKWAFFAKGGAYSPYYGDIHLLVNWANDASEMWNDVNVQGRPKSNIWMLRDTISNFFFRQAVTYSERTASGFSPRLAPPGCVYSQVGPIITANSDNHLLPLAGVLMSRPVAYFIELMVESADAVRSGSAARHYTQNVVRAIPVPSLETTTLPVLTELLQGIWNSKQKRDSMRETGRYFIVPSLLSSKEVQATNYSLKQLVEASVAQREDCDLYVLGCSWQIEQITRQLYDLDSIAIQEIDQEFGPHPETLPLRETVDQDVFRSLYLASVEHIIGKEVKDTGGSRAVTKKTFFADRKLELLCSVFDTHPTTIVKTRRRLGLLLDQEISDEVAGVISYIVGCTIGYWDIRMALTPELAPKLPDALDPLPLCPPGTLVGLDGLPATPGHIVSEAWLRARPDAITLPPEGSFDGPATIPDEEYPIRIAWDGILVDDPGLGEHLEPHPSDVVRRVREVLAVLWPENHDAIEAEACEILGVRELRDYFRKPTKFFSDHLKRYSKSRRKAPIYWPLSTASGSYTLWLYYHRLDGQILYTAVNRYVTPKIEQVEGYIARLEADLAQITGRAASNLRDQLDDVRASLAELREFREELLRIAGLPYKPNLNDGVIINAAPLHRLFGLRKWAKDTEAVWRKLEKGEYDWAHMAYTLWPERVQEVCKHDRSIAIAHGLEHLCEVPEKTSKKKGKRTGEIEDRIKE